MTDFFECNVIETEANSDGVPKTPFRFAPSIFIVETKADYDEQSAYFDFLERNITHNMLRVNVLDDIDSFNKLYDLWVGVRKEIDSLHGYDY